MTDIQKILLGKAERIYQEYYNSNGDLVDPTTPKVYLYDPNGLYVCSGTPTKESTGVYYLSVTLSTASTTVEGSYQAYWEGTIGGNFITQDTPQYLYAYRHPWSISKPSAVINSVRRMTGDTNPENYRISTEDMYYFFSDAIDEVQTEYNWGYTVAITNTAMSFNQTLYSVPFTLFKLRTAILVLESTLMDSLYDGGSVQVGDIKVDVTGIIRLRQENLKRLREEYSRLMYEAKMNGITGYVIDTYAIGRINNSQIEDVTYEPYI